MVLSFVAARPMWHAAHEMFSIVTVRDLAESPPLSLAHLPAAATLGGVKE
jgi:hypothetical protein